MNSTQQLSNFDLFAIITASATLIVIQSWNSLIKEALDYYIPDQNKSITAKLLYTMSITFILAVFVYYTTYYGKSIKSYSMNLIQQFIK